MGIYGEGQKDTYNWKDAWRLSFVPEHIAYDLFMAANVGKKGSIERIEAINEAIAVARLNYPQLFRPRKDFSRVPRFASECFEKNRYVGWKNIHE